MDLVLSASPENHDSAEKRPGSSIYVSEKKRGFTTQEVS